jgi:GT2 family glycosyltransferase
MNYGCPGGRNRGVSHCNGEYIFFCDNDGILHKDAVKNAVECIMSYKNALIVSGRVMDFSEIEEVDTQYELGPVNYREVYGFRGGVTLHSKKIYDSISKYPDDYMYGGEETYLSLKVLDKGYQIIHCDQVILWHKKSTFARDTKKESLTSWRNKLTNIYRLYPLLIAVPFILRFSLVYQYYALRDGYYADFIRSIPSFISHAISRKREPVQLSVVVRYLASIE